MREKERRTKGACAEINQNFDAMWMGPPASDKQRRRSRGDREREGERETDLWQGCNLLRILTAVLNASTTRERERVRRGEKEGRKKEGGERKQTARRD